MSHPWDELPKHLLEAYFEHGMRQLVEGRDHHLVWPLVLSCTPPSLQMEVCWAHFKGALKNWTAHHVPGREVRPDLIAVAHGLATAIYDRPGLRCLPLSLNFDLCSTSLNCFAMSLGVRNRNAQRVFLHVEDKGVNFVSYEPPGRYEWAWDLGDPEWPERLPMQLERYVREKWFC